MITILCGKSGCGKDTILNMLTQRTAIKPIISTTTRPIRENEQPDREYHFVTKETFLAMLAQHQLIEYRTYQTLVGGTPDTWYYGSAEVDARTQNHITILDMDGVRSYLERYGKDQILVIQLHVPDDIRKRRAISRGSFDETEWNRRLQDDNIKFADTSDIDALIENTDDIEQVYETVYNLMKKRNAV